MIQTQFKERYYLHLIRSINTTIDIISQVLLILRNKRLTLAEKGIISELDSCLGHLLSILGQLKVEKKYILKAKDAKRLRQITTRLDNQLEGFHQAANHSLNYLEQYFEHDFWLALRQDQMAIHLAQIVNNLQSDNTPSSMKC